jgi:hypothetical protein
VIELTTLTTTIHGLTNYLKRLKILVGDSTLAVLSHELVMQRPQVQPASFQDLPIFRTLAKEHQQSSITEGSPLCQEKMTYLTFICFPQDSNKNFNVHGKNSRLPGQD